MSVHQEIDRMTTVKRITDLRKTKTITNTINEKVEPKADLRREVDRPDGNLGSTHRTGWLDRFEDWINFIRDVVKILTE